MHVSKHAHAWLHHTAAEQHMPSDLLHLKHLQAGTTQMQTNADTAPAGRHDVMAGVHG